MSLEQVEIYFRKNEQMKDAFINPSSVTRADLHWVASLQIPKRSSEVSVLEKCYFLTQNLEKSWVTNPQISALARVEAGGLLQQPA